MSGRITLAALLLTLMGVSSAVAESGHWGLRVSGRYGSVRASVQGTELFKDSYGGEAMVTRGLSSRWSVGVGYNYVQLNATSAMKGNYFLEYGVPENDGYRQQTFFALALFDFQDNILHPFFAAGLGAGNIYHTQGGGGFDGWGTDWIVRAGMSYHLGEKFRIIGEVSYDVLQGQDTNVATLSGQLGLGYSF